MYRCLRFLGDGLRNARELPEYSPETEQRDFCDHLANPWAIETLRCVYRRELYHFLIVHLVQVSFKPGTAQSTQTSNEVLM